MKVGFISLGCAKNQVNCEQMIWKTYEAGYEVALGAEDCDVAVVNTCGFLQEAREEALAEIDALAQAKAQGKLQKILVTGCMAQWWKDEIQARCPQADGFVGVSGYEDIAQVIAQALEDQHPAHFGDIDAPVPETDRVVCTSDYWAWLRIAEGCDNRCAYCIIPFIRGKFRSRPEEAILAEAQDLAQAGMQELIVVAQDITRYGLDLYGARTLAKLLPKLCAIEGIHWVRLHYLYPDEITDELIDVIANEPKIVKYLDIPIQHISDHLLKSMHRRGTGEEIRALFRKLRERIPGLVLRTSLIAGFPGETEEDFEELCTFLREFRIQRAGVFPFSPEEGSAAATYPDQVDEDVKRRRVELITELQLAVVDDWCESMMGQVVEVLCEYDPESKGGNPADGRKVKGATIHWVDAATAADAEVRLYDYLFTDPAPDAADKNFLDYLNPDSLQILIGCKVEQGLAQAAMPEKGKTATAYQFMRQGYFCLDNQDAAPGHLVFNRSVSLKDSFKKK